MSSEQSHDYLQFYIDGTLKDQISGEVGWQQKSYSVTSGIHILCVAGPSRSCVVSKHIYGVAGSGTGMFLARNLKSGWVDTVYS